VPAEAAPGARLQQQWQAARLPQPDVESEIVDETPIVDVQPGEPLDAAEPIEIETMAPPPEVVDTTAELLGRATARPRKARAATPKAPRAAAPRGTKKTAARRVPRAKKMPAAAADTGETE